MRRKRTNLLCSILAVVALVVVPAGTAAAQSSGQGTGVGARVSVAPPDYPEATFYHAYPGNYSNASRPTSNPINKIVIHVTQEPYDKTIDIFQDPSSGVSAHYIIRSSDGEVAQTVYEEDIAHHAGNWSYNQTSVGIEHEGYVDDPSWFTAAMYESSAKLAAYLVDKYGIPIDREHILGHSEVPGATHTDPGQYWDWDRYMSLVRQYATAS